MSRRRARTSAGTTASTRRARTTSRSSARTPARSRTERWAGGRRGFRGGSQGEEKEGLGQQGRDVWKRSGTI